MRGLVFVVIALSLAGLGALALVQERADDDEVVEAQLRSTFAQIGRDVKVSCQRAGSRWRCDYADGSFRGSIVIDESSHHEISIIH